MNNPTRLYVCGFPYATTEDELTELFSGYGSVREVQILTDRKTGDSRGFGFVSMGSPEEATEALVLNGERFGGRRLKVEMSVYRQRVG